MKNELGDLKGRTLHDVLTYTDIANYLGIDPNTLRRYRRRGDFPVADDQIGDTPLWTVATVQDWLANRKRGSRASNNAD